MLLLGGLAAIYFWIKSKHRVASPDQSTAAPPAAVPAKPEVILPCGFCGVHLPQSEGLMQEERFYCSAAHRDQLDSRGWIGSALWRPSPNCDARSGGLGVDLVVIHHISLPPGEFKTRNSTQYIIDFFQNRLDPDAHPYFAEIADHRVSSHFLIARQGYLVQFVSTVDRAWHAGASQFEGRERCNDFSIGIELEGDGDTPFEEAQYQTLQNLILQLQSQNPDLRFAGHSDIAPNRKTDPGMHFDWARFQKDNALPLEKLPFGLSSR
ncbi:MAG: 1,6-anhydro-N-acetylmuramyl-L-alanine amidase AmpD [Polynucleobacter sp.]|nr:1,6-anhydro-N-acetylmuramyl-L-alanine amidase AmpD [Polynucleobacter sp.]